MEENKEKSDDTADYYGGIGIYYVCGIVQGRIHFNSKGELSNDKCNGKGRGVVCCN